MTDEQRKAMIAALLRERLGYDTRGLKHRVAEVDAQLRVLGHGKAPAKRAQTRG